MVEIVKPNSTLLALLQMGCMVELPRGATLKGDPKTAYIEIKFNGDKQGVWSLDKDGLQNALNDAEKLLADFHGDNFEDITGHQGFTGGIGIVTKQEILDNINDYQHQIRGRVVDGVRRGRLGNYNIVNEDNLILESHFDRVNVRRAYEKRLYQDHKPAKV